MKVWVPTRHHLHTPSKDFSDGLPPFDHMEKPERVALILEGLERAGITDLQRIDTLAEEAVFALHDRDYIEFLLELSKEIEPGQEYLPSTFHDQLDEAPLWFRGGAYCREIGTPIGPQTVETAFNSAATAIAAAEYTLETKADCLALCRPPGHHAGRRRYGGYSFFNNAYLAAEVIRKAGLQTAVLDIDYHIGDGSVEFATAAAPYFSLHADPGRNYPYLASMIAGERPNVTLRTFPVGVTSKAYVKMLRELMAELEAVQPQITILSLGLDTLGIDYIQDEQTEIKVDDFQAIGAAIAELRAPVLFIMEGGYDPEHLASCTEHFFTGYCDTRAA